MAKFQGTVLYVSSKPGKFGIMNAFKLDSTDIWFSSGNITVPKGSYVEVDCEPNAKGFYNVKKENIKYLKDSPATTAPSASATVKSAKANNPQLDYAAKDGYWQRKEVRDIENDAARSEGAARNTAIEFVKLLLTPGVDAVKLASVKQADREDVIYEMVELYTSKFNSNKAEVSEDTPSEANTATNSAAEEAGDQVDNDWK